MSTQLRREIRAAFEDDFEPSPQLADWVFVALEPKGSRIPRLTRLAAVAAVIVVVASAGFYAVNFGIPGLTRPSPVSAPTDDGQALSTGSFFSGTTGWIVKRAGLTEGGHPATTDVVYQTSNGGTTWTERLRFKGEYDWMVFSPDGSKGVVWALDNTASAPACGGSLPKCGLHVDPAIVYRTTDGGHTWLKMPTPRETLYTGAFLNPDEGWLLTYAGGPGQLNVQHTADGGATWELVGHVGFEGYPSYGVAFGTGARSLVFADPLHGWLVPNTYADPSIPPLLATKDGGRTWQGLSLALPAGVTGVVSGGAPRIFADGTGILPLAVRTPTQVKPDDPEPPSSVYIYPTADGGLTWGTPRPLFPAGSPQAKETVVGTMGVWNFMDAKHWWVTNQTGTGGGPWAPRPHLLVTADGSLSWKTYDNSPQISDLFFVGPTAGWAEDQTASLLGGNVNGLIRTTDGGAHWSRVEVPTVR